MEPTNEQPRIIQGSVNNIDWFKIFLVTIGLIGLSGVSFYLGHKIPVTYNLDLQSTQPPMITATTTAIPTSTPPIVSITATPLAVK
jgi:hypothetical protein